MKYVKGEMVCDGADVGDTGEKGGENGLDGGLWIEAEAERELGGETGNGTLVGSVILLALETSRGREREGDLKIEDEVQDGN